MKTRIAILLFFMTGVFYAQNPISYSRIKITASPNQPSVARLVTLDPSTFEYGWVLKSDIQSPFVLLDEGNGTGITYRDRNALYYGNLGLSALDFSISNNASSVYGATGINSTAFGLNNIASGQRSFVSGGNNSAVGNYSASFGFLNSSLGLASFSAGYNNQVTGNYASGISYTSIVSGYQAAAYGGHLNTVSGGTAGAFGGYSADVAGSYSATLGGWETFTKSIGEVSIGILPTDYTVANSNSDVTVHPTDRLFTIGNGNTSDNSKSNAMVVLKSGLTTFPSLTPAMIAAEPTGKVAITKEYFSANVPAPLGYTAENVANKSTSASLGTSDLLYPTQKAVKTYVDWAVAGAGSGVFVEKNGDTMSGNLMFDDGLSISSNSMYDKKILFNGSKISISTADLSDSNNSIGIDVGETEVVINAGPTNATTGGLRGSKVFDNTDNQDYIQRKNLSDVAVTKQDTDTELTALASTTSSANQLPYYTGSGTASTTTISPFLRTVMDDADAATVRGTIGAADDTSVLHKSGTETASGMKTFTPGITLGGVASPTYAQGKAVYDTDNECMTFYNSDSNVSLQVGQESWIRVKNMTGSTIPNGAAVYISGSNSGVPLISLAKADAGTTTVCAGLTTEAIANNATGFVTTTGLVNGVDTSAFSVGAIYLSSTTAGGLTQTAPSAPNYRYRIGFVTNVDASTGKIHVTPSTAALGNGTANQLSGINTSGTAQEYKSLTGTSSRLTVANSTGSIVLDISSTFEALLSKIANRIDQNNASTTSTQFFSVISDETGTGSVVGSSGATVNNMIVGTQTANDNSTKAASTAYADAKVQNSLIASTTVAPSATSVNTGLATKFTNGGDTTGTNMTLGTADAFDVNFVRQSTTIGAIRSTGLAITTGMSLTNMGSANRFTLTMGGSSASATWSRNLADAIAAATFNNANASSTGNIADFQYAGSNVVSIGRDGKVTIVDGTSAQHAVSKNQLDAITPTIVTTSNDFGLISANNYLTTTVAISGAVVGNLVQVSANPQTLGVTYTAEITSTGTATLVANNTTASGMNPPNTTYKLYYWKQ